MFQSARLRANERKQFFAPGRVCAFQGESEQQGGAGSEDVLADDQFVVLVGGPVLEVVENLEGNAETLAEFGDRFLVVVGGAGEADSGVESGFEGGRGFERVNLEGVEGGEGFV